MKIGVFDSGVGGKSVANALQAALPDHEILYAQDRENVPYGTKSAEQLYELVVPILRRLAEEGCDIIVIACNTVTTNLLPELQQAIGVELIGVEPMIKTASKTTLSKIIAVCATPMTLQSARYHELLQEHADGITVLEPDCSDWAFLLEQNDMDHEMLHETITAVCEEGADVIVLGCTHYHWIEEDIRQVAARYDTEVIQPEKAIIKNVKRVIAQLG